MEPSTRPVGDQAEPLSSLAAALLHHVSEGSAGTTASLEQLYEHFKDKSWKKASSDALLSAWRACVSVLGTDNGPEDCARALHILRSLSHLCTPCGTALFSDWTVLEPAKVAAAAAAAMARHPDSVTVQTAGCALYARLAGCAACQTHSAPELAAAVVSAGAVPALAAAVRGLGSRAAEPAAVVCAAEALAALRFMAEAVPGALDAVDGGALALATAARQVAAGQGSADFNAVALLSTVAVRPETPAADALAAAMQAVAVADAATPGPAFLRATRGAIALPVALKARIDAEPAQLASFMQVTAATAVRHLRPEAGAGDTARTWVALLHAVSRCADAQSVPVLAESQTAACVAHVSVTASPDVAAEALRTLWLLVPACSTMDAATKVSMADSVGAALSTLVSAPTADGMRTPSPDISAGLICGVACLGALQTQPSKPLGADTLRRCLLSGLDGLAVPGTEWDESRVGWTALAEAVRAVVGAGDVNAADADGCTLVHSLAVKGQSRCLGVVLEVAGDRVDLLSRTKAGETALQLARQGRHAAATALLDGVTQRAAEARQAALLAELEESSTEHSETLSKKTGGSKKKKAVSRSASFAADQPEGKAQKVADDEAEAAAAEEARAQLRARMEEEYERALEQRRQELAAAAVAAAEAAASGRQEEEQVAGTTAAMSTTTDDERSSSAERPCTPRTMLDAGAADGSGPGSCSGSGGDDDGMTRTDSYTGGASVDDSTLDLSAQAAEPDADADAQALMSDIAAATSPFAAILGPPMPTAAVPAPVAAPAPAPVAPAAREHSLFGSPSLTGDLFGGTSFGSSLANHSSLSGSPTMATAPLGGSFGLTSEGSGALPDALFVAPGALTGGMGMGMGVEHPSAAPTLPSASLLASLGGSSSVRPLPMSPPRTASLPPLPHAPGSPTMSPAGLRGAGSSSSDGDSDACTEPTRHLWIGNLGTRTARAVLKAVFEAHGLVEDVVTFPGRMYAFVNYATAEEAIAATEALHNKVVPELTGDRPLLLKYRPVKKAAMHLRALGEGLGLASVGSDDGAGTGGPGSARGDPDGNSSEPSPRIWLGNIAPTATSKTLQAVLGRFGPLTDAAVFPARIGPLGYAFVKFEQLDDAVRALEALNNTVVPPLSGSKQLKMRYKPAGSGPSGRGDEAAEAAKAVAVPSRHLWLGNITQKPPEEAVFKAFSKYGRVDSARVFPAKAYAFVNFADVGAAVRAMADLDGVSIPALTGVKPLVMRFQQESQQPARPATVGTGAAASAAAGAAAAAAAAAAGFGIGGLGSLGMHRVQSESALALAAAASLNRLQPGLPGFGRADSLSGPDDGWGVHPAHDSLHRSSSLGLLASASASAGSAFASSRPSPSVSPFAAGLGEPSPVAPPSLAPATSASTSQLSAVLNSLAALQRAASGSLPPPSSQSPQDIAALSSMLASQSLTPTEPSSVGPSPGWSPAEQASCGPSAGVGHAAPHGGLDGLLCPLSQQLMTDPVVAADGVTYHRPAILQWLATQAVSPVTQAPLAHASLVPNQAVKDAVMGYLRMQLRVAA